MFRNSNSESDTEAGHMCSGRVFKGVHLENLFKKNYGEEGFYSGEEVDLTDKEHSKSTRTEEGKAEELHQSEPKTLETTQTTEVSNKDPPVVPETLNHQNSQNHKSPQSTITSRSMSTRTGNLGSSMADEMRLPIFRGDGSEDPDQHQFLCEAIWNIKNITDEAVKRNLFSTTLRDHALSWYMKLVQGLAQPKTLNEIKKTLIVEFKKPNLESQCITQIKYIKQKVAEPIWEFNQRCKTLTR